MSIDFSLFLIEDEFQEDQVNSEGGGVVALRYGTIIELTVTTEYVPISVDIAVDESLF